MRRRLLVGVRKFYSGKVVGEFDDIIIVIKDDASGTSRVISCGCLDSAVFIFMFVLKIIGEVLFIDIIVVHDLEELFKLFGEVIILIILSTFLKF